MYISSAPLQGYTDAIYRRLHRKHFAGVDQYYTPFVRIEKGEYRTKDLRDIAPALNDERTIPQLLPASRDELARMVDTLLKMGWSRCDLNFGCPFPMLAKRGKGSGMLAHMDTLYEIAKYIDSHREMSVSIKMRLGYDLPDQGLAALDIFNALPLEHITCHARLGTDRYTSALHLDHFQEFYEQCRHPLVYNGNVETLDNAQMLMQRFPLLKGLALGRSLLQRPQLAAEIKSGTLQPLTASTLRLFHNDLQAAYAQHLQGGGEHQVLSKLKTIWDYLLVSECARPIKKIKKATTLAHYNTAVEHLMASLVP